MRHRATVTNDEYDDDCALALESDSSSVVVASVGPPLRPTTTTTPQRTDRSRRTAILLTYVLPFIGFLIQVSDAAPTVHVSLSNGSPVIGEYAQTARGKEVVQFLGIPFAEPPIGNLRFRKPVPKRPWRKPLLATTPPKSCVQSLDTYFGDFDGATMWNSNTPMSEDCLYLNVHVPERVEAGRKLPVMVWVYGGGFWSGCITLDVYDPKVLCADENVIFVAMNYRVSMFGFLYLGIEEAPGNMGLWDQQVAIKWVYENIEQFGGDPESITLFGESAGAASVSMHMLSEKSAPYFNRAIIQSSAATAPWATEARQVALSRAVVVYEYMKCGNMSRNPSEWDMHKVLMCLLEADADKIRDAEWVPVMEFADFPWVPVVDGDFLIESPATSVKTGHFKRTQLLAGSNMDEAIYFIVYQLGDIFPPSDFFTKTDFVKTREKWLRSITNLLPRQILKSSLALQAILHEYEPFNLPVRPTDWLKSLDRMLGDFHFTCSVNEFAQAHTDHGGSTFYYHFTHLSSQQTWPHWMGVLHGYEVNFIFGEPFNTQRFKYTKEEQELSARFMRYWANFARTGDPNKNPDGSYTPDTWPPYTSETQEYMNLTVESEYTQRGSRRIGAALRRKQCAFWKSVVPNLLSVSADVGESFVRWRQQMDRWESEYITDWQYHFEQYKKYQAYRHLESDFGQCNSP